MQLQGPDPSASWGAISRPGPWGPGPTRLPAPEPRRDRQAVERVDVSEPASISTGIAARYARAVLDLAREGGDVEALEADVASLDAAIHESADLRDLMISPLVSRDEQGAAIDAVAERMGLGPVLRNTLALMASKRRLFVVPHMLATLRDMLSEGRDELTAEVRAPQPLSEAQAGRLREALKASTGKDVALDVTVDEGLIGGLVVQIGSRMIDTSVRAKLNAMKNTMKEAH